MNVKKYISGTVSPWMRWDIQDFLDSHKNDEVTLVITSSGGYVVDAIAISDLLAAHGNVTVEFSGIAASAATWMAYGAKKVQMHEDTLWLCHKTSSPVTAWENMNIDELSAFIQKLEQQKKSLEVQDAIIVKKYLDRAASHGKSMKDVTNLMAEERYLAPSDVLEWGFVDEVLPTKSSQNFLTNEMLNELHLPAMPGTQTAEEQNDGAAAAAQTAEPAAVTDETSFIQRIVDSIRDIFKPKQEENVVGEEEITQTPNIIMNKKYTSINALLGVEGVEEADGKVTLSMDQVQKIEAALSASAAAEKSLDSISEKVKNISGIENKVNALSLVLDKLPVGGVVVPQKSTKNNEKPDSVDIENADDINAYVRGE